MLGHGQYVAVIGIPLTADRSSWIGEATVIACVTAVAYLSALAYRAGDFVRLGLPITLSTVRLTDAALAGLYVLLGGVTLVVLFDLLESSRPGLLDRLFKIYLLGLSALAMLPVVIALVLVLLRLYEMLGWVAVLLVVAILSGLAWAVMLSVERMARTRPKFHFMTSLWRRHPKVTTAIVVATLLCLAAFTFGFGGVSVPIKSYPRTRTGQEVAVAIFEDRMVLAGVTDASLSSDATLTGEFRVVDLPDDSITFGAERVRRLHRQ